MSNNVQFERPELTKIRPIYDIISDALEGELCVKSKGPKYLPVPSECEGNPLNPRYIAYKTRAVYYNITQPTRDALVGQLFLRPPVIELPTVLQGMIEDANGEGLTLEQLTRRIANYVLPFGRGGLLTDFPQNSSGVTVGQLERGEIKPTIRFFEPWSIRNWAFERTGTSYRLTLLVLDEAYEKRLINDDFTVEKKIRQRVYLLKNNSCTVTVYEDNLPTQTLTINNSNGKPLDSIPFEFIGSENNDPDIDDPPFYNLANLNIAHFRNSADYEESVFLVGQPTPVYSGLTEDWVNNYFQKGVPFGSRASITLPIGATAQLLQALPNSLAYEAMVHKEEQMIAIGAKILRPKQTVERKQAEIQIEDASQKSVLTSIKDNVQLALIASLKRAADFVGADKESIKVVLNDNFDLTAMTAEEIRFLLELYKESTLTFSEIRENLRRSGLAKMPDDQAKTELMADKTLKDSLVPELEKKKAEPKPVGTKLVSKSKSKVKRDNPNA